MSTVDDITVTSSRKRKMSTPVSPNNIAEKSQQNQRLHALVSQV